MNKAGMFNGTFRAILWIAGVVFAAGVTWAVIYENRDAIAKNIMATTQNREDIIKLQVDVSYIRDGVDDIKTSLKQ